MPMTSPANSATSSDTPSGIRLSVRFAVGTSAWSAWVPWSEPSAAPWPNTRAWSHFMYQPRMQKKHRPQAVWKHPRTRSPSATLVTWSPAASTVPTNSWPIVKPGSI